MYIVANTKVPFGKISSGSYYTFKLRVRQDRYPIVQLLKAKHPELEILHTKSGYVIFGGTFHTNSNAFEYYTQLITNKLNHNEQTNLLKGS